MWSLKNKINKQKRNKPVVTEQTVGCQMGWGWGWGVKKVKGVRSTNWLLQNSHSDVKYSIGTVVTNIVITVSAARWVLDLSGGITS